MEADVCELPATSLATATSVCWPALTFFVFQDTVYGAPDLVAMRTPSTKKLTCATPEPESPELAVSLTVPVTVAPFVGEVMATVGAVVSILIDCDFVASTLPALSHARYLTVVVAETMKEPMY